MAERIKIITEYRLAKRLAILAVLALAAVVIGGCAPLGPAAIKRDRLHYSSGG